MKSEEEERIEKIMTVGPAAGAVEGPC